VTWSKPGFETVYRRTAAGAQPTGAQPAGAQTGAQKK